jgi:type I restriction enzyme S subunit
MTVWKECKLGDAPFEIIDGDRGVNYPKQDEFSQNGYCLFLNAKNVTTDGFSFNECYFISKEKDQILRKGKLQRNDIVLTTRGTVGNIGFFNDRIPYENIRLNSGMVIIRPDPKGILPEYTHQLFKYLKSDFDAFATGSAQPQLPIRDLKEISFLLPPLPEQRAIAGVLSSLDDKIDLLHRQNKTLEGMAEALWRKMFVEEVDPGWKKGKLGEEMKIIMGQSPPGNSYNENKQGALFFQGRAEFGYRFPEARLYCTEPKRYAKKYDTLVSVRAPVGDINMVFEDCCIGRGLAAIRHNKGFISYTFYKIRSLKDEFDSFEQQGTVFGSIGKDEFKGIDTFIAPERVVREFENNAKPIDDKIFTNSIQIRTLSHLRDMLLPKLMSGEMRVKL